MATRLSKVDAAAAAVRCFCDRRPRVGLILGTGLGSLADHIETEAVIPYEDVPHMPKSTALAHQGQFVCGAFAGTDVIAMQGRCHLYEGYSVDQIALPVRVMRELGAKLLIVSNASGGLNPQYATGDIMVIDDHIDLMWRHSPQDENSLQFDRPPRRASSLYNEALIEQALAIARREDFVAHRGVYVAVTGPNYETRAEYRFFRRIGGDAVGMSTVPEVNAAVACGLDVLALSVITNVARPDSADTVSAEEVVDAATMAEPQLRAIVSAILRREFG